MDLTRQRPGPPGSLAALTPPERLKSRPQPRYPTFGLKSGRAAKETARKLLSASRLNWLRG